MLRSFHMTALTSAGMILIALQGSALADSVGETPAEGPVIASLSAGSSPDWTGFWAGGELGFANVSTSPGPGDERSLVAGLTGGYDFDFGSVVVGGGFDYGLTDADVGNTGADLESVFRVRLRAGFEIGQGLLYGTGGYAQADTDTLGSEDGYFLGAGYEHLVSPSFAYGGEVVFQEFPNYAETPVDVDATTLQFRGTFRF
ncbi:MAG: outer membrane beta-barrel protein [Pseudomonadota bacterium]